MAISISLSYSSFTSVDDIRSWAKGDTGSRLPAKGFVIAGEDVLRPGKKVTARWEARIFLYEDRDRVYLGVGNRDEYNY
jgi:hypothetical protein